MTASITTASTATRLPLFPLAAAFAALSLLAPAACAPAAPAPSAPAAAPTAAARAVAVTDPWARAMVAGTSMPPAASTPMAGAMGAASPGMAAYPGRANSAAYMLLKNETDAPDRLVKAESPVAEVVELHETSRQGDMMRMQMVPGIPVPAKGTTELKPGGYHVMLIALKQDLTPGAKVPLTLHFESGAQLRVEAEVRQPVP